jgi:hypothetical protein
MAGTAAASRVADVGALTFERLCSAGEAQGTGAAGAKLEKPVLRALTGGSCESDGKGSVATNFGEALAFSIVRRPSECPT